MNAYTAEAHINYEGFVILGIFSTREKAKECCDKKKALDSPHGYDFYEVNCFAIDDGE
jgi:hypothetical protein